MRTSFEIAIHQGCRSTETSLPLSRVSLERMEITFDVKGGKTFTTKLHDALVPLISRLKAEGRERTFDLCPQAGREWTRFFRKIDLLHLCFHCTRVTVITRLCRTNVSESQAMRFVGHASETIHRIYQRLRAEDVTVCVSALRIPLNETKDVPPATQERVPELSSPQTRIDTQPPALPKRTNLTSSKRQPALSQ
jgi:integrase